MPSGAVLQARPIKILTNPDTASAIPSPRNNNWTPFSPPRAQKFATKGGQACVFAKNFRPIALFKEHIQRSNREEESSDKLSTRNVQGHQIYRCSKSTGAVTSCTRKYFASAGYFRATASYIAYATLR
jgi:hypothetical protein